MSTRFSMPTQQYGTRCTNSSTNASCRSRPWTCLSCTQRRKLGSSTAATTPSSVVSGSSVAKQQPQAATRQSAAAATYRTARPRKQFWRASLRHCSAGRRPAILTNKETQTHSSFIHIPTVLSRTVCADPNLAASVVSRTVCADPNLAHEAGDGRNRPKQSE